MDNSSLRGNNLHCRRKCPVKGQRLYGQMSVEILKKKGMIAFDELVSQIYANMVRSGLGDLHDDKNVRKRVYDVINVLSAMGMAYKDGKHVFWSGDHPEEIEKKNQELEEEKKQLEKSIKYKTEKLQHLHLQLIAYKSLLLTKKEKPNETQTRIHLPFVVVKVNKDAKVKCNISNDKMQHLFTFDQPFEILDNMKVLQAMGMAFGLENHNCTSETLDMIYKQL